MKRNNWDKTQMEVTVEEKELLQRLRYKDFKALSSDVAEAEEEGWTQPEADSEAPSDAVACPEEEPSPEEPDLQEAELKEIAAKRQARRAEEKGSQKRKSPSPPWHRTRMWKKVLAKRKGSATSGTSKPLGYKIRPKWPHPPHGPQRKGPQPPSRPPPPRLMNKSGEKSGSSSSATSSQHAKTGAQEHRAKQQHVLDVLEKLGEAKELLKPQPKACMQLRARKKTPQEMVFRPKALVANPRPPVSAKPRPPATKPPGHVAAVPRPPATKPPGWEDWEQNKAPDTWSEGTWKSNDWTEGGWIWCLGPIVSLSPRDNIMQSYKIPNKHHTIIESDYFNIFLGSFINVVFAFNLQNAVQIGLSLGLCMTGLVS